MKQTRGPFLVLFGLLLVIATVAAWDYIEVWRLDRELARIESLGEPATTRGIDSTTTGEEETAASRYYRAAVALVDRESRPGDNLFQVRIGKARNSNEWPNDLLEEMRGRVSRNGEALLYLDKAAALEFEGFREFPPMSAYQLHTLFPVAELRTNILALEGRSAEAALSLYSSLRLQRTMGFWSLDGPVEGRRSVARRSDFLAVMYLPRQLQMLVSRTRPAAKNLAMLAEGFAALDDDDLLLHDLLWLRATSRINVDNPYWWRRAGGVGVGAFKLGESIAASIQAPLYRPFLLHWTNGLLRDYGDAIAAQAGKDWPDRLDVLAEFDRTPFDLSRHGQSVARELALIRTARTIVAIEQYRRANAERIPENGNALSNIQAPLIDPFSGQPLKILQTSTGYVVYSVGTNRRDDGGRAVTVPPPPAGRQPAEGPPDVGISVTLN